MILVITGIMKTDGETKLPSSVFQALSGAPRRLRRAFRRLFLNIVGNLREEWRLLVQNDLRPHTHTQTPQKKNETKLTYLSLSKRGRRVHINTNRSSYPCRSCIIVAFVQGKQKKLAQKAALEKRLLNNRVHKVLYFFQPRTVASRERPGQ